MGLCRADWGFLYRSFPLLEENPLLDLGAYHTPRFYGGMTLWYYFSPAVLVLMVGLILLAIWRVWFEARDRSLLTISRKSVFLDHEAGQVKGQLRASKGHFRAESLRFRYLSYPSGSGF